MIAIYLITPILLPVSGVYNGHMNPINDGCTYLNSAALSFWDPTLPSDVYIYLKAYNVYGLFFLNYSYPLILFGIAFFLLYITSLPVDIVLMSILLISTESILFSTIYLTSIVLGSKSY